MLPTLHTTVSRNPDIITSEIDGDMVMMSVSEGSFYGLNAVGAAIWHLLDTPASIETIVAHVLEIFEVSEEQCQTDILIFIESMVSSKTLIINE
jgi:hypothetical protein